MRNFIRTKTQPTIFYLPRSHRADTQELLNASARLIDEQIETKKREVERELEALTEESAALMNQETTDSASNDHQKKTEVDSQAKGDNNTKEVEESLDQEPDDVQLVDEELEESSALNNTQMEVEK